MHARAEIKNPTVIQSSLAARSLFFIAFNGGAFNENICRKHFGLHHFLEHLVFRDWKRVENIATRSCVKINAVTDDDRVYFHIDGLTEGVVQILKELKLEKRFFRMPSKDAFEVEKNVILQEYDSMLTHRPSAIITNIQRHYFNYYNPFGSREVVENVTYDEMCSYADWFKTPSTVVFVAGDNARYSVQGFETLENTCVSPALKFGRYESDNGEVTGHKDEMLVCDFVSCQNILSELDIFMLKCLWSDGYDSPVNTCIREDSGLAYSASLFADLPCSTLATFLTIAPEHLRQARNIATNMFYDYEKHITLERFNNVKQMIRNRRALRSSNTCSLAYVIHATSPLNLPMSSINTYTYDQALSACQKLTTLKVIRCSLGNTLKLGGIR